MTSGKGRSQGKKGKNKVQNRVVNDDTPTPSPPTAMHGFRPQHSHFPSSGHTTLSPQYVFGVPSSARVFSSTPSQGNSSMPPPGYGYGYQHRSSPDLCPSSSPGYHIRTSRRPMSTMTSSSPSSLRRSPSATPSPEVLPNISGRHLRDGSSSEPERPCPTTPVCGGNPPIMVPGTDREMHDRVTIRPAGIGKHILEEWRSTSRVRDAMNRVSRTNHLMKKK